ncbi:hypothetical protein J6590_001142 [Homalodisca vitripennis]|nr:hypothetical protein J6590_001142 [Homalodisca vitripennis]
MWVRRQSSCPQAGTFTPRRSPPPRCPPVREKAALPLYLHLDRRFDDLPQPRPWALATFPSSPVLPLPTIVFHRIRTLIIINTIGLTDNFMIDLVPTCGLSIAPEKVFNLDGQPSLSFVVIIYIANC